MAWNVPGGSDNGGSGGSGGKDPWGQKRKPAQGVPDIDKIVSTIQQKLGGIFGGRGNGSGNSGGPGKVGGLGAGLVAVVALTIWILSGFYIVNQGENGVVLRFGAKNEITEAGLRWHFPYPIESVEKVNVEKISTIEIGYRGNSRSGGKSKIPKEALMLTEDENIIDIEFAVQYRAVNAANYIFNVRDPDITIAQATESAIREVVGRSKLDYVFENRKSIELEVKDQLQKILDGYLLGVGIQAVEMQRAQPPDEVKAAFDDAVRAREDRERLKNESEAYANDVVPRARGGAGRILQEAEGYKASVVARAEGDARRFNQILAEYVKAPAVTRERLYIETMEQVLSKSTKVFIDQKGGNNLIYLPLDRLLPLVDENASTGQDTSTVEAGAATTQQNKVDMRNRADSSRRGR